MKNLNLNLTLYSARNSVSTFAILLNSHDSSKAVRSGSLELSAIRDDAVSARYALMRDCECLSESCSLDTKHSSQAHLESNV